MFWGGHEPADLVYLLRCFYRNLQTWGERLFPDTTPDHEIGRHIALYTGHASDEDTRRRAASGGCVGAFLVHLLESKVIAGAVVTGFSSKNPLRTEARLATTPKEVMENRSSKYCPVSLHGIRNAIAGGNGAVVIVGLPCHLHGLRKLAAQDPEFKQRVLGFVGIYCSGTRTTQLPEYLLWRYKVNPASVTRFCFRDEGYPGNLVIERRDQQPVKVPYHTYYREIRACFNYPRCLVCHDHAAELADLSFGDIHIPEFLDDPLGVNSIIVRNPDFHELLQQAEASGRMVLAPVEKDKLVKSQARMIRMKKQRIKTVLMLRKWIGGKNPDWETVLPRGGFSIRRILSLWANRLQAAIGKRRCLWPLVRPIAKLCAKMGG